MQQNLELGRGIVGAHDVHTSLLLLCRDVVYCLKMYTQINFYALHVTNAGAEKVRLGRDYVGLGHHTGQPVSPSC